MQSINVGCFKEIAIHRWHRFSQRVEKKSFYRDAWQFASRPRIEEEFISGTPIKLADLSATKWREILAEAYSCLDPGRGHRGRGIQTVTLRTKAKKQMDVSPHLHISTPIWTTPPGSAAEAGQKLEAGFQRLRPIYAIVESQSSLN